MEVQASKDSQSRRFLVILATILKVILKNVSGQHRARIDPSFDRPDFDFDSRHDSDSDS